LRESPLTTCYRFGSGTPKSGALVLDWHEKERSG
jgi:hypothetical protein